MQCARGLIPDEVIARRDKKIFVSRPDWMPLRTTYAESLRAMARDRRMAENAWLRGPAVVAFVEDYLRGRNDDGMAVWRLFTAWRWLETFQPA